MSARALALVLATALLGGCGGGDRFHGWPMEPALPAPDLLLHGAGEKTLSFARTEGKLTLATFGYTSCPDVCPTTLADWRRLRRALGADTARVRFVFVSLDWRRDTPRVADAFATRFHPSFSGVTADSLTLLRLMPSFKVASRYHTTPDGAFDLSHTDYMYLVDSAGRVVRSYEFGTGPKEIASDLRRMLRG